MRPPRPLTTISAQPLTRVINHWNTHRHGLRKRFAARGTQNSFGFASRVYQYTKLYNFSIDANAF
jgi:hypothetical protein